MSILIRTIQRAHKLKQNFPSRIVTNALSQTLGFANRTHSTKSVTKSPFESNILRILRNEIEYQAEYAPPHQPVTEFNSFVVEDRPGEQVVTIRGKFGDDEDIKIEATMFDGFQHVPVFGDDSSGVNVRLHNSLIVDISKGEDGNELEFVCSAWPDGLDVEKVFILKRGQMAAKPYLGPDFRNLKPEIQEMFCEYLDTRGVNNELSTFLHEYMMNKDRIELLRWMDRLKSFVEK
ncbi:uncharacterized protein At2g39795, mitochondrial isoform X1 [Vicia villosa]|uniref:uncharacterized protein At2g39795, mitochondrial isoform X1 n=1 Tax=Vicia villosa TaxID=3911 RepID=UPI00273C4ADE|nr:uncharacterized protein At2g39795, mitochondrial isoform X1 [Vicia villosa]